jgi:hypothetical protein
LERVPRPRWACATCESNRDLDGARTAADIAVLALVVGLVLYAVID